MPTSRPSSPQVKVDSKKTADDAADVVMQFLKHVFMFLVTMYALTFGYDQAAWFFHLPQANPLEVGGALLFLRVLADEVSNFVHRFRH